MASLPVLSVWPTMLTVAAGLSLSVAAKLSSIGRKLALMSARPVSKETSLGMSILRRLSAVWLTCTPVPWVACCMARFCSSILFDQMLPTMAPAAAPSTAPPAARLPPPLPVDAPRMAPSPAPTPAPVAVPRSVGDRSAQPDREDRPSAAARTTVSGVRTGEGDMIGLLLGGRHHGAVPRGGGK